MHCPSCNHYNRPDRRFCTECGAVLNAACPSCGAPIQADEKFCGSCGERLQTATGAPGSLTASVPEAATPSGERRQLTEQRTEISVGRDHDAILCGSPVEDFGIVSLGHVACPYVHRIMAGIAQTLGKLWRERVVDGKLQAIFTSGSSRSRTAAAA